MVHGGGTRNYNDIFGTSSNSRTMPGMNASCYPGFEFESNYESPKESTPKRSGTMIKRPNKLSVSPGIVSILIFVIMLE